MGLFSWLKGAEYTNKATGIQFPDTVGELKRGKLTEYEAEPGQAGVAVAYSRKDAELTVYIRALPTGSAITAESSLRESLAGIKELEARGQYANVKIYSFADDKVRLGWKAAAFTSQAENHFIVSFIYCSIRPGHLVKIRATTGNAKNEGLESEIQTLLKIIDRNGK